MFQSKSYKYPKFFIVSGGTRVLVIALALFGSLSLASAQNRFVHLPSYPAGGSLPTLLAQHDVNGDGKLDLIVMNVNATTKLETVSLLPGTGTGGYQAPKTMAYFPVSYGKPLLADVNRDGHLDLDLLFGELTVDESLPRPGRKFSVYPADFKRRRLSHWPRVRRLRHTGGRREQGWKSRLVGIAYRRPITRHFTYLWATGMAPSALL